MFATVLHVQSMRYADFFDPSGASVLSSIVLLGVPIAATVPLLVLLGASHNRAAVAAVCALAPVLEEMLFRGVILRGLLVQHPMRTAIGASALIFGAAHLNVCQFCIAFCLGLFAGWPFERARSLVPCIALHALYNASITIVEFREGLDPPDKDPGFGWSTRVFAALSGALGAHGLARMLKSRSGASGEAQSGA